MSENMTIRSHRRTYTVVFDEDHLSALEKYVQPGDFAFVDSYIHQQYPHVARFLEGRNHRIIESDERAKSFHSLVEIIDLLLGHNITKTDRLVAIGGGITQDVTAFVAAILFRGIEWIFFPTNLLSQCDSCIGSKTSINFRDYKNQIGGFYPPTRVIIDTAFLKTLAKRDILSGFGEMMHYFCVSGPDDFNWARNRLDAALKNGEEMDALIRRSLSIKKDMIEIDEFDTGPRNVFNYGHSFGHALESVTQYGVPHGIAVSFGMDLANVISAELGLIPSALRNEVRAVLSCIWEGTDVSQMDCDRFFAALKRDKKNEGRNIKVILTKGLGKMFKTTLDLNAERKQAIRDYFKNRCWESDI